MSANNCNPLNSVYCNLKVKLAGSLSENDLNGLYSCTLCNDCHTADLNRGAREIAVGKNLIPAHLKTIAGNIRRSGNPYGIAGARKGKGPDGSGTILFRGCTPTYKTPEIMAAAETLLGRLGVSYGLMDDEPCCGNILFNLGDRADGAEIVDRNIAKFRAAGVRRIITVCPGCYAAFNRYYKGRDGFEPEVILAVDLLEGMTAPAEGFVVQDPCHAKEKGDAVRRMLPGVAAASASPCCGAGAGLMSHDRLLAGEKAKKAFNGGTAKVVTYCPFCYLNLSTLKPGEVADLYMMMDGLGERAAPQGASFAATNTGAQVEARSPLLEKLATAVRSIVG